jgi:transcriptional regulator with XRE-family HTH domain
MAAPVVDIDRALDLLGWSGAELARRLDVGEDRVSAWRRGRSKRGVPGPVAAYLELALRVRDLLTP